MELTIRKGLDLHLQGAIDSDSDSDPVSVNINKVAVCPDDFDGFIPKTDVRPGDKVYAGQGIMHHKNDERIKLISPIDGIIAAIERGERRHIERIVIDVDKNSLEENKNEPSPLEFENLTPLQLTELLAQHGLLAMIRRRPYADIPEVEVRPRDIFITDFDSAPLAVTRLWAQEDLNLLQAGAACLSLITSGRVYVSHREDSLCADLKGVENVTVKGPHPAGLAGIQAANIRPVNKGETIWTLSTETMWRIGSLLLSGKVNTTAYVAVCGSCVNRPYISKTIIGAQVRPLLEGHIQMDSENLRVISGNVFTGKKVSPIDGFLHFPYTQLTVIPEISNKEEFMGWGSLSPAKMSVSPSFPGKFFRKVFNPDARIYGGRRAMIMSGEYERVFPMDIMAEYLIKAINSRDIERMEKLGIYEVAPEDFALAECLDSSKLPLQSIVRQGLDFMKKELQ